MSKFISIHEASMLLGVSPQTLRRWEKEGKDLPVQRTSGGQRRYDFSKLSPSSKIENEIKCSTLAYARVSSHDQKEDLQRQEKMLEMFCASRGWSFEVISDLGSGMNYQKKGLRKLIQKILNEDIGRLVLTHKDRLLRFGAELIFSICEMKNIEVVLINQGGETSFEEELAADVLEIITVFSARLYGSRSRKNKKLIENLEQAVRHADHIKGH
ncbi:MAG: IS607 family transposase [Chlamydiales bacterium]